MEIDEQSHAAVAELHVSQQLGFEYRKHFRDGFEFDDDLIFDENVNSVTAIELYALISQR
jgi:hypothetical protein